MSTDGCKNATHMQDLIPGAYERNTLTYRQPGSMGGPAFGSANAPIGPSSMDAATIADREKEGGGALSQRRRKIDAQPQAGQALTGAERNDSWLARGHSWFHILRLARR
jgi:hypothetical protein